MRIVVASAAIIFILVVVIRFILDRTRDVSLDLISNSITIYALYTVLILISITFVFIFLRNIIKSYYEKDKIYNRSSRFKNRLIFFFISFSIIPTLLLFFLSTDFLNKGISNIFNVNTDELMSLSSTLKESFYEMSINELKHFTNRVQKNIKDKQMYTPANRTYLTNKLREWMSLYHLDVINIYKNQKELRSFMKPVFPLKEYNNLTLEDIYRGLSSDTFTKIDSLKNGEIIRIGTSFKVGEDKILVVVGKFFPNKYVKSVKTFETEAIKYSQLKSIKKHVRTTYMLLFILITILIIFSASWLGYFLAKGITNPIEKLVNAATEITKGNLDVNIDYNAKDEFNILIKEFNKMVVDLREHREKLNKRTIELRHRKSITENILKNITSGVIAINAKGEIIELNPEAERMLSMSRREILKKKWSRIFSEPPYISINDIIKRAFSARFKLHEQEVDIKIKGKVLNLAIRITPTRNPVNNKFSGLLVVLTDLTELMKAQRKLVWREVAKRIAHEIKNPLTPIQISAQRIQKSMDQPEEKFRTLVDDSLNIILHELDSITKLADEFSNFARLPEIRFTKGDVNQILDKLITVYSSIYSGVTFIDNLSVDLPIILKIDTDQIKRIFVNILDNAIEAMDKQGEIEITTSYIKESQFVKIEISDNGPGIPDEDKQKLFIPYFSKKHTGTGLGLAIAHNIIEEHNGLISVVDNSPKGAKFIIELPS